METMCDQQKILVVDDEALMVTAMRHVLEEKGYMVVTATNGFEAIHRIEKEKPDLIVLDIMMPYVSGFEFLNWVRSYYLEHEIPIIIVSTLEHEEVMKVGYNLGASHYMTKPVSMDELLAAIHRLLADKSKNDR